MLAWAMAIGALIFLGTRQARFAVRGQGDLFNALALAFSFAAMLSPLLLSQVGGSTSRGGDLVWALLGALSALIVAAVGYRSGLRALRGLALCALLGYGYLFYFSLGATLLHKAYALLATGALLLLLRVWTTRRAAAMKATV